MANRRRRRGRPSRLTRELGAALIELVINDDVPIVHASRRLGLGVRTVYDGKVLLHERGGATQ